MHTSMGGQGVLRWWQRPPEWTSYVLLCGDTGQQLPLVSIEIVLLSFRLYNKHSSLIMANWPQTLFPLLHLHLTPQKLLISVLRLCKIWCIRICSQIIQYWFMSKLMKRFVTFHQWTCCTSAVFPGQLPVLSYSL